MTGGRPGHAFAVAALLLVGDVAPALLGPLTGTLSDRFDVRRLMIGCELVQAATVGVSAATLPRCPPCWPWSRCGRSRRRSGSPRRGPRLPVADPRARLVRALCLGFVGVVACNGVDDVALVYLARDGLGAGERAVAALYAAVGIGLLLGYLVPGRRSRRPGWPSVAAAVALRRAVAA